MLNFGQLQTGTTKHTMKGKVIPSTHMNSAFALLSLHRCQDLDLLKQLTGF